MISWIKGMLVDKSPHSCVVSINGLGYTLEMMPRDWETLPNLNEEVELHVQAFYREDAQSLYAFMNKQLSAAFFDLNKASGVGPKMALQILDTYTLDELSLLVSQGNFQGLTRIKGVGPKLAKRLIIDLKGRFVYQSCPDLAMQDSRHLEDAITGLCNLGYKETQARAMVRNAGGQTVAEIIKNSLKTV